MKKINSKIYLSAWNYLGWFGCVYLGKNGYGFASLIFPAVSWKLLRFNFQLKRQILFLLMFFLFIGLLFDSAGVYFNLIKINPPAGIGWLPIWMISLWLLFVSSLPLMQSLFNKKYALASLFGAIFGPLSYRAGTHFGTLEINGKIAILTYAIFWSVYIPSTIFWLGKKEIINENS